jgi:NADH dehydrogenase
MKGIRVSGFVAWLIWWVAHIYFLIGFRNRLAIILDWAWNYFTFQRGARLITASPAREWTTWPRPQGRQPVQ